jgi:hypothetical protein
MSDEQREPGRGIYHIRVQGSLDGMPADRVGGLLVVPQANGETRLVGPLVDQAALHDLLGEIRSRELTLLLVGRADCPCPKRNCPRRGQCTECAAYHGAKGKQPYCLRKKLKWDKLVAEFS